MRVTRKQASTFRFVGITNEILKRRVWNSGQPQITKHTYTSRKRHVYVTDYKPDDDAKL